MDEPIVQDFDLDVNNFSEIDYCDLDKLLDTNPLKPVFDLSNYVAYVPRPTQYAPPKQHKKCMTSTRLFMKGGKLFTLQLPCNDRRNCSYCRTTYTKSILSDLGQQPKYFQYVADEKWLAWRVYFHRNRDSQDRYWRIPIDANGSIVITTLERKGVIPVDDQEIMVTGRINDHYDNDWIIDPDTGKPLKKKISRSYKVRECGLCHNELGARDKACSTCGMPYKGKSKASLVTDPVNVPKAKIDQLLKDLGLKQDNQVSKIKGVEIKQHSRAWDIPKSIRGVMSKEEYINQVVYKGLSSMQRENRM